MFHDFIKGKLLTAYNVLHNFDITCLSELYINLQTLSSDDYLSEPRHNMSPDDHPSNNRRREVSKYYKESLHIKVLIMCHLQECTCSDQQIGSKTCNIITL